MSASVAVVHAAGPNTSTLATLTGEAPELVIPCILRIRVQFQ